MSAVISACGRYRYSLTRHIPSLLRWVRPVTFVMLNPSTADASEDAPTIRRCISFAERIGGTELEVLNLFALRATDPKELLEAQRNGVDPIGPENDEYLRRISPMSTVIVAWGAHPAARDRVQQVLTGPLLRRELFCLGVNSDGSPKHPLYLPKSSPLTPWVHELETWLVRCSVATGKPVAEVREVVRQLGEHAAGGYYSGFRATGNGGEA